MAGIGDVTADTTTDPKGILGNTIEVPNRHWDATLTGHTTCTIRGHIRNGQWRGHYVVTDDECGADYAYVFTERLVGRMHADTHGT